MNTERGNINEQKGAGRHGCTKLEVNEKYIQELLSTGYLNSLQHIINKQLNTTCPFGYPSKAPLLNASKAT